MAGFIVGYQTKARGYVKLDGQQIKFWEGVGPMTFSGTLDEFATAHPRSGRGNGAASDYSA